MVVGGIRKSCERHLFAAADTKNLQLTSYMNYFQTHVSGGFYLTPSVGVSYKLKGRQSLSLSIGYELQEYNQLVTYENAMYLTQYVEDISNHALTASIGFTF